MDQERPAAEEAEDDDETRETRPIRPRPAQPSEPLPAEAPQIEQRSPTSLIPRPSQTLVASSLGLGIPSLEISSNTADRRKSYLLDKQGHHHWARRDQ